MQIAAAIAVFVLRLACCESYDYGYTDENYHHYSNYYEDPTPSIRGSDIGRIRRFEQNTLRTLNSQQIDDVKGAIRDILSGHENNPFKLDEITRTSRTDEQYGVFTQLPSYNTDVSQVNSIIEPFTQENILTRGDDADGIKWIYTHKTSPQLSAIHTPRRSTIHAPAPGRSSFQTPERSKINIPERSTTHVPKRSTLIIAQQLEPYVTVKPVQVSLEPLGYETGFAPDESMIQDTYVLPGSLPKGSLSNETRYVLEPVESMSIRSEPTVQPDGSVSYESTYATETTSTEVWIWTVEPDMTSTINTQGIQNYQVSPFENDAAVTSLNQHKPVKKPHRVHIDTIGRSKGDSNVNVDNKVDWKKIPYDFIRQGSNNPPPPPRYDLAKFLEIVANLTDQYATGLVHEINQSLRQHSYPTCRPGASAAPTTPSGDYGLNQTVVAKCFVCGLDLPGIPVDANCADAFAGDFLPLVPVDPRAKSKVARFRRYCRYGDFKNYWYNTSQPRTLFGRWTGGCSVRWTDLASVYTQRSCRNRKRAVTGLHYGSKRMAKLEMALNHVEDGCIVSPMATLLPLSRGISLFARFHACVCMGNWCNAAAGLTPPPLVDLAASVLSMFIVWIQ